MADDTKNAAAPTSTTALAKSGQTAIQEGPTPPGVTGYATMPPHLKPLEHPYTVIDVPGGGKLTLYRDAMPPPRAAGANFTSADGTVSADLDADEMRKIATGVLRRRAQGARK